MGGELWSRTGQHRVLTACLLGIPLAPSKPAAVQSRYLQPEPSVFSLPGLCDSGSLVFQVHKLQQELFRNEESRVAPRPAEIGPAF